MGTVRNRKGGVGNKEVTSKRDHRYQIEGHVFPADDNRCQQRRKPHNRFSCGRNQSQDGYFKLCRPHVIRVARSCGVPTCGGNLSWDIRFVLWRKFDFYCGTAVSSVYVT